MENIFFKNDNKNNEEIKVNNDDNVNNNININSGKNININQYTLNPQQLQKENNKIRNYNENSNDYHKYI